MALVARALFTLFLCAAPPAVAGTLVLSGDSNIGSAIDGSFSAPINPDNATFFSNILGRGTNVIVQYGTRIGGADSIQASATSINDYYSGLRGVTSILDPTETEITDSLLSGTDLFISIYPGSFYAPGEIAALANFMNASGNVFLMGENQTNGFDQNARINRALSELGSSMRLTQSTLDGGYITTTNIDPAPLTAGIGTFTYAFTTAVNGGTSLIRTRNPGNETFIAYESFHVVPEPSSLVMGVVFSAMALLRRKRSSIHARGN